MLDGLLTDHAKKFESAKPLFRLRPRLSSRPPEQQQRTCDQLSRKQTRLLPTGLDCALFDRLKELVSNTIVNMGVPFEALLPYGIIIGVCSASEQSRCDQLTE